MHYPTRLDELIHESHVLLQLVLGAQLRTGHNHLRPGPRQGYEEQAAAGLLFILRTRVSQRIG